MQTSKDVLTHSADACRRQRAGRCRVGVCGALICRRARRFYLCHTLCTATKVYATGCGPRALDVTWPVLMRF